MQTQDAPAEIIFKLWPWLEANKTRLIGTAVAVLAASGIIYFMSAQKAQKEVDAGEALTSLMVAAQAATPGTGSQLAGQYSQLAGKYSGTAAGQRAQLQSAAVLFDAGNYPEAQAQFEKFLADNPAGMLAATATLGVATCLEAQNKPDQAATAYQRVVSAFSDSTSVAPAEFALGRIAEQQNKFTEAMGHFENVARASTGGSLAQEAMMHASELKTKIAAAAPKPAAVVAPKAEAPTPAPAMSITPAPKKP